MEYIGLLDIYYAVKWIFCISNSACGVFLHYGLQFFPAILASVLLQF